MSVVSTGIFVINCIRCFKYFFHDCGTYLGQSPAVDPVYQSFYGLHNITIALRWNQGFWIYLYFRIRHSSAHVWTILNKMASFGVIAHVWTILNRNGVFWCQHLQAIRVWTWPKYKKHHHDFKNQLCRFIDMYIRKIFWLTAPCQGCPEKEIWGQG